MDKTNLAKTMRAIQPIGRNASAKKVLNVLAAIVKVSIIGFVLFSTKPENVVRTRRRSAIALKQCFSPIRREMYGYRIVKLFIDGTRPLSPCATYHTGIELEETVSHTIVELCIEERNGREEYHLLSSHGNRKTSRERGKLKVKLIHHYSKSLEIYGFQQNCEMRSWHVSKQKGGAAQH